MKKHIGIIVGSLRKGSYTKIIARNLMELIPPEYQASMIDIGELEVYNQDYDDLNQVPKSYTNFRNTMMGIDAVIFVTPEYNRSVPPALKNALDIGSRPYGSSVWTGKPAAIVSVSPGNYGGFGANNHLRQSLVFLDMPPVQQPEVYLGHVTELLTEDGKINNPRTVTLLQKLVDALIKLLN